MGDILRQNAETGLAARQEQPGQEQRSASRFTLLIRTAKLICSEGEFCCVVRDASTSGIKARIFHKLPEVEDMLLEMPNGDLHAMRLAWEEQDHAGFRFTQDADISRIVESPSRFAKRAVRINVQVDGEVANIQGRAPVTIHNLSQQGAMITCDAHYSIDQRLKLIAPLLPEVQAKVRWRKGNSYGLVFDDLFQFGELARLVAELQMDGHAAKPAI